MLRRKVDKERSGIPIVHFADCPAKTYLRPHDGLIQLGRSTLEHCQIVGEVARELIRRFPSGLQALIFPENAAFGAACHDIGKVSPCSYEKIRKACSEGMCSLAPLPVNPELEKMWGGHAGVSQVAAISLGAPRWVPEILGQHHGFSPNVDTKKANDEAFGGELWQAQRQALVNELKNRLNMDWPVVESESQSRVLAGLASVSDWIGSGQYFENPDIPWQGQVKQALDHSGFVSPSYRCGLSFHAVFGFEPRSAQLKLINAVNGPGVYVLEAPMGLGKTEAALYCAYRMLEMGKACGIYFALPTQLTSNKIYERFNAFLQMILTDDCKHSPLLLHGNAWLVDTEMGEEGRPGGSWFHQAKRGLLAPFAVGTIDQALMAAMNVKHGFVRAFGLAGKVVILDEVHTYDAYTGTLLDALVSLLRSIHCTVIILSATLNRERRCQLVGGHCSSDDYPLITAFAEDPSLEEIPVGSTEEVEVIIRLESDDGSAVNEALDRASTKQQVIWIENTVKEAQERYLMLASRADELGIEVGLLHSRFKADDRQRIEAVWVDSFGKGGWAERSLSGRILVGTQILEQSLDIDSDFMISRFAPSDMLLQRLGRLWRHDGTPRPKEARREAWFLAPTLADAVETIAQAFGSSAHVYSPYVLCRSLEVWESRKAVSLPMDIRELIESTYKARSEKAELARLLHELDNGTPKRKGRLALQQLARIGLSENGKTLPESKAQTRYSEMETHEVLLLRDLRILPGEMCSQLELLDGRLLTLPIKRHLLSKTQWKNLTADLMRQIVKVRATEAPQALARSTLEGFGLHNCFSLGDPGWSEDESTLRVALVDRSGYLQGIYGARLHDSYRLEYRYDLGYRLSRHLGVRP